MAQLRALGYVGADSPVAGTKVTPSQSPAESEKEETTVSYHRNLATYYLSRHDYEKAIQELNQANLREKLPKSYAMLAEALDVLAASGWDPKPASLRLNCSPSQLVKLIKEHPPAWLMVNRVRVASGESELR